MIASIGAGRRWQSVMDIARGGPIQDGGERGPIQGSGSCRLALAREAAAAARFLLWWRNLGLHLVQDALGDMLPSRTGGWPSRETSRRTGANRIPPFGWAGSTDPAGYDDIPGSRRS